MHLLRQALIAKKFALGAMRLGRLRMPYNMGRSGKELLFRKAAPNLNVQESRPEPERRNGTGTAGGRPPPYDLWDPPHTIYGMAQPDRPHTIYGNKKGATGTVTPIRFMGTGWPPYDL